VLFAVLHEKKEETRMKFTKDKWMFDAGRRMGLNLIVMSLMGMVLAGLAGAQSVSTTTVQGTVYLANGQAGAGILVVSWPAFTTANGQLVAADSTTATIASDGFVSVNLAPNLGATPAGLYYTAVYYMIDGSTNTEYWVVPAAAQASLGAVQAQVMPAAQAVQAVSKAYVDQSITELTESLLTASGGTLSGPLYLSGDPTQPLQAADKHYVDETFALAVPLAGGNMTGPLTTPSVNGVQLPQPGSSQTTLQEAMTAAGTSGAMEVPPTYAGTDGFTNPNGVYVSDLRQTSSQQFERSVKEFGAVCDGSTDDTNALQAAINYAHTHGVALTIPQGTCKTRALIWHGESIGGMGKQVSALLGFPGQDVLSTVTDSTNLLGYTRLHDLTIYVDQSVDVSCTPAEGRAPAGSCAVGRPMESNSIFSPGGNGLTGTVGTGAAWSVGNCAIAMPAAMGAGGNGLRVAKIESLEIEATGVDPMAAEYPGAHSTHTCGLYLAQWPQWSEFRNIDIRGLNTGIAIPVLPVAAPAGLNADSNRWQNITVQATHGFTAAAGSNNVLDNVVAMAGNSAATAEPPTGLALNLPSAQQGWTVRNAVVLPAWDAVQPQLTVTAAGGAVTGVSVGSEHGLGFDPYGTQVPLQFSGSCTAQATASVNSNGSIGTVTVTSGGVGCSGTTTASVNVAGIWDTDAPVNLIAGQSMTFMGGNLLKGNGGYTVWNATGSESYGTQLDGGGGTLPGGGSYAALVESTPLGSTYPVDQFPGADFGAKLEACLGTLSASYGGTCDARNFTGTQSMGSNLTISTANVTVLLPCATISTAKQVIVTAGTRNASLRGCALRGASTASASQGGTVFLYSGTGAMVQVGDPTYAADTMGFHMDNAVINTTAAGNATTQGLAAYRTQEMDLDSLYFLGNSNQTGMTLDGTGNYTGGSFFGDQFDGYQTAVNAIGHQISNPATTDWMNASTFVRLHIDCPTSGGNPISGTYGINLQQGDGNTFTGGDVEGCSTALHLGANAQNNTIVGLRNENSTNQVVADAGSSYNDWMTGGTMFTGALTDNGTRNSFLDTFHRSFNGMNGDWYGSQQDATVTNHYRIGIGAGNERGLLNRYQTDYGYRWTMGLSDATAGEQFYQVLDELNNVYRLSIGQYNHGQSSTNNQTLINAAGTGAVVLNGSNNSGTGGVVIGSGGATESTVATITNAGNAQFNGTLQVGGTSTFTGTTTVKNLLDAEIDAILWAGLTTSQKESFIYKDWNGNSQWYLEKDASNNWELNSAVGGLDSFKAYQSTNSGDTYINASNTTGVVRVNYETGSGAGFKVYGGSSSSVYASFTGTTSIMFPGLAASSGHDCVQIDTSGYITNTGSACGTGTGGSGTVGTGTTGQIAYYAASGTTVGGMSTVPVTAGGTGAATAAAALASLGGAPAFTLTTNGTSGAATYTANVINIPQYAGSSMSWPAAAGISVYGGSSAWGTSLTAPASAIVGISDTQTLTNKSVDGVSATTLGYVDATSSIQTQLNGKQASLGYTPLNPTNNLSDVASASAAIGNLGGAALAGSTFTGAISAPSTNGKQTVPATGNIQTAINTAGNNGTIDLTPGTLYTVSSTITISNNYVILNGNGACIMTSAPGDGIYITGTGITLNDVCLMPGGASTGAAIHDAINSLTNTGLTVNRPHLIQYGSNSPTGGYYWYYGIQVDTDELFVVNGYNQVFEHALGETGSITQGVLRCDSTFCGSGIYNPGGSADSAVGYINDSAISMQCFGNPIDWEGGNDLTIKSTILQGFNQFGLRVNKLATGGSGNITLDGVHNEVGSCTNPALNGITAQAGYIINDGANLKLSSGTGGGGQMPVFPNSDGVSDGTENYAYYAVIHSGGGSTTTQPLPIGYTTAAAATLGGSYSVVVTAPGSPNSGDTCDYLRVDQTVNGRVSPYSTSGLNYAIPGEQGVACGPSAGTYISFTDSTPTANLTAYTFQTNQTYGPSLNNWPGSFVLTGPYSNQSTFDGNCGTASIFVVPVGPSYLQIAPNITCEGQTYDDIGGIKTPYGASFQNRIAGANSRSYAPSAFQIPLSSGYEGTLYTKGAINFGTTHGYTSGPSDALTIIDSNPYKTLNTPGNRPTADAGDTAIGVDGTSNGLAFRDPSHVCQYIGVKFDGASWSECLTATAKTFTVPVTAPSFTGSLAGTATNATNATNASEIGGVTVTGTPSAGNVPTATSSSAATWQAPYGSLISSTPAGDMICAHGSDTTIGALNISNITYSSPTYTFTTASGMQTDGYVASQTVQVQGTTGGTGNFNAQYKITAITSNTGFTATTTTATGTSYGSGGTVSMVCNNSSDDITNNGAAFATALSFPAMTTYTQYGVKAQYLLYTPATAPNIWPPNLYYGASILTNSTGSAALHSSSAGTYSGSQIFSMTALTSGLLLGTMDAQNYSTSYVYQGAEPVAYASTSSAQNITLKTGFVATGLGSITSGSGGTISGTGTCTLSSFNNGATGATATVTFTTSGSWTGATFSVTNTGYGATASPTSATLASGTATCSGTPTLVTVLGGAQGTALRLMSLSAKQQ
jgi:hypothetical protein